MGTFIVRLFNFCLYKFLDLDTGAFNLSATKLFSTKDSFLWLSKMYSFSFSGVIQLPTDWSSSLADGWQMFFLIESYIWVSEVDWSADEMRVRL